MRWEKGVSLLSFCDCTRPRENVPSLYRLCDRAVGAVPRVACSPADRPRTRPVVQSGGAVTPSAAEMPTAKKLHFSSVKAAAPVITTCWAQGLPQEIMGNVLLKAVLMDKTSIVAERVAKWWQQASLFAEVRKLAQALWRCPID